MSTSFKREVSIAGLRRADSAQSRDPAELQRCADADGARTQPVKRMTSPDTQTAAADMGVGSGDLLGVWSPIASAPKDGTRFKARGKYSRFVDRYKTTSRRRVLITWWGKASHVPLYGWCHGRDIEDIDLWEPTEWLSPNARSDT